jgi:pyruvate/2-oxoglutarate dehydrogenase complex dihydrolipoamide acyltransferase (E2) component
MSEQDLLLPDIGDFDQVEVIEIHVKAGDSVKIEDPLITLESDKATMDIPSPVAGTIKKLNVKVGDKIAEGGKLGSIETGAEDASQKTAPAADPAAALVVSRLPSLLPVETLSPMATLSCLMVPAKGDGISIVALSDSRVSNGSSTFIESPTAT